MQKHPAALLLLFQVLITGLALISASTEVRVASGQDAVLPCQAPESTVTLIEWSRSEQNNTEFVLVFRWDGVSVSVQDPRVELRDPERTDGDASVVLRNVSTSDSGSYACRLQTGGQVSSCALSLTVGGPAGDSPEELRPRPGNNKYLGLLALVPFFFFCLGLGHKDFRSRMLCRLSKRCFCPRGALPS